MSELTSKQKAFIEELPKNKWNGTKAAIAAGYSPKSAGVMAHRLLNNPQITKELEKRMEDIAEKTDVEIAEIVAALRQIAFGGKKATNTEALRALELLGKYKGMFLDRVRTEDTIDPLSEERINAAMQAAREAAEWERLRLVRMNESGTENVPDFSHKTGVGAGRRGGKKSSTYDRAI